MHGEDMSVFFDPADNADTFVVLRLPPPGNVLVGITGAASKEGVQGFAIGLQRELRYPAGSPDLVDGDELLLGAVRYRVRGEPEAQNDGSELVVQLSQVRP
ncbi:hypothetical protein [Xylophilus ampelinus]|uniref:Uncharacterized protein n=1 Tax=Xylophilus ampelinus TaxID=54067 RepID=A0A318SKZ6_9BURK|nr:hypothetical protein [Xylophilus ampelinus]MCS4509138.1 hypothetical protein [Xylophilus ampelinus]PYE79834.1 hypothetical protein DFQ15_101154 [Xylophilus ampelinus]